MHLSYENEIDKFFEGSRSILLNQIVSEQGVTYDGETSQFSLECAPTNLPDGVFRLGQAIIRVCDLISTSLAE